ncbi:response regulator [Sulfurimonas sp. SAG-AH-194-I05]|nr:response regulator [Sulfurimonas sp. SAG-AH-194-I05]MDF1874609.1 response regulator [Sulfurimonas sp. SAG-AH-194-I05]
MKIDDILILENSKKLTVLYVEDDAVLRESTQELFVTFFQQVDIGIDGKDGLLQYQTYYEKMGRHYDLVITDIQMSSMDGLEMARKMKLLNFEQVIIIISAFNEVNYLQEAIRLGLNGFLTKPLELKQVRNVLYQTTQLIAERILLNDYYKQMEENQIVDNDKIDASGFKSAQNIVHDLEKNKEKILHLWMKKPVVKERLDKYFIDKEYFQDHYATNVIEYFLSVINGENDLGDCPVIFAMLDFFKQKKMLLADIFMVCIQFKNTLTEYILSSYTYNQEIYEDISIILDRNFEGMITNYLKLYNSSDYGKIKKVTKMIVWDEDNLEENVQIKEEDTSLITESKEEIPPKIMGEDAEEELNYTDYVLETDVYELQDLEEDIDTLAILVTQHTDTIETSIELGEKIYRYGSILANYPLFSKLGSSINKLGINLVDHAQLLFDDKERMSNITALIEGFVNDLIVWRKEIFEHNISNPHFLDDSFFSNVDTIIMFIEYDENAVVEENELDDDMFFDF